MSIVIIKKIKSVENNKDVFGFSGPFNTNHVWPLTKGGSDVKENEILLSAEANQLKGSKSRGVINGKRFMTYVVKTKNIGGVQKTYGVMFIKNGDGWLKVVNG